MGPNDQLRQVAEQLVKGCREGKERENLDKLYAEDATSVEAYAGPEMGREVQGLKAIHQKHDWWESTMEELESSTTGPFYHGDDRFSVLFNAKAKNKDTGEVMDMQETATYHVKDGKIVREEFFYAM
ncbi:SnoaL-like domain-containing protein [Parvularcula maris]|nr:SnoaL-like domain-containing protein [Parvularcula maris]